MPLGPSHLPHYRQKLTLLYFSCQENTPKPFPLVRLQLKMALLAASSKSMQAPQQSTDLPSSWTIRAPWSARLLFIYPNYDFSLHLWVIFLNYQIWLKISVLKWHCDTSNQQEKGKKTPKYINIYNREFLRQVLLERNRLLEISVNHK